MRLTISGETKLRLRSTFGLGKVTIKAISGDFYITELPFQKDRTYSNRTAQVSITSFTIDSESQGVLQVKMVNAEADKIRLGERTLINDTDDAVKGFAYIRSIEASTVEGEEATHSVVTMEYDSSSPDSSKNGTFLSSSLLLTDYFVFFQDTVLEEGESTEELDTNIYQFVYVNGTGTLELSSIKKKIDDNNFLINLSPKIITKTTDNQTQYLIKNKGSLKNMDAFTTNSSYWQSSGVSTRQWVMYSYNTHNTISLQIGFKFRTTSTANDSILFSKDGSVLREWSVIQEYIEGEAYLSIVLFKTNDVRDTIRITTNGQHNDGKWHTVDANWASKGVGLGGVLTVTFDGVTTNYNTTIDSIQQGYQSICLNGRDGGYGPSVFDCEYVTIGGRVWYFSGLLSTLVYSTDGEKYFVSINQNLSVVWKKSTDSFVRPTNMIDGGYRYTNGVTSEDIILPKLIEKAYLGGSSLVTNENALWGCKLKSEFFGVYKGVEFRFLESSSTANYYKVIINQDKGYNISVSLRKTVDGTSTTLTVDYANIENGVDIDLRIERDTATNNISLYINDVLIRSYIDSTFTSGEKSSLYTSGFYFVSAYAGATQFTFLSAYLKYVGLTSYLSYTVIPPLSFSNVETAFYLSFNEKVAERDTEYKLYTPEETSKNVYYTDLVNGGFGNKITYRENDNDSFSNFKVKR